jgi:hypothetical protein
VSINFYNLEGQFLSLDFFDVSTKGHPYLYRGATVEVWPCLVTLVKIIFPPLKLFYKNEDNKKLTVYTIGIIKGKFQNLFI